MRLAPLVLALSLVGGSRAVAQPQPQPAGAVRPDDAAGAYLHTIARGDTLIGLSRVLLADPRQWPAIQRLNRVRYPRRLRPGSQLRIPLELLRSVPGTAEVLWVRGQPQVMQADGTAMVALLGATIGPGATLVTGEAQSVRLRLSTGSTLTIGERSRLTFTELRSIPAAKANRTILGVDRGRIETAVEPAAAPAQRYEIRTPVVTTAVRGTEFRVAVDEAGASAATEVTGGRVDVVRADEALAVEAGFGTMARRGQPLAPPRALLPAASTAGIEGVLTRLPIRVRWPAVSGAASYRVQVAPASGGPLADDRVVPGNEISWNDLLDGAYVLTVRAVDTDGLEGMDVRWPFDVDARPVPPIVQAPDAGATLVGDAVSLQWTRPGGVTAFDVQVAREEAFAAPVVDRAGTTGTALPVSLPPGSYVWRIASRDGAERGPWSDALRFTLRARPPAGPAAVHELDTSRFTLRWPAGVAGDRYRVQVSADGGFATRLVDSVVAEPVLAMPRPRAGTYFVRVSLVNADDIEGPFGPTQSFLVPTPPPSKWWRLLVPLPTIGALIALL